MFVRALNENDVWAYQRLRLSAAQASPQSFSTTYPEEVSRSLFDAAARLKPSARSAVFGAYRSGRLVGLAGVRRNPFEGQRHNSHLWGLYVLPCERGKGAGKALLTTAIAYAKTLAGVTRINLTVAVDNAVARQLYMSHGFVVQPLEDDFDAFRAAEMCMALPLDHQATHPRVEVSQR